ncbi:MAG TPA: S41 family peptidase [Chloroflexota bacterium]|nr:S41 family peptidase [Chloroflexota bacterium]
MATVRFVLVFLVLFLVVAVPAPARAQAAPGPFVKQAFDLLMDRFVLPPKSGDLLKAGWDGGIAHIKGASGAEPGAPAPSFTGDRGADWNAFLAAYPALVATLGASPDQHALDRAIVAAMAKSLNSSHTYLTVNPPPGLVYGGVGVQMSRELIVTDVFPGSPAEAAGVRPGDRLIAVDGVSVEGMTSQETSSLVRGPVGSAVQLTVRRAGQAEPTVINATRAEIVVPWVTSRVLDGGIGYLKLGGYPQLDAIGPFDEAVTLLDGADVKALVVDVRGNGGGPVDAANKIISRFVREGALYQRTNRQGQTTPVNVDGSAWGRNIPIAVLVNAGSGGNGGELLPSALREHGLGYVVGSHTAGSLAAGVRVPLQDGSTLTITVETWRTGKGQEIEGVGLEPDLTVELDPGALAEGRDTQLEAALTYLKEKIGS